VNLDGVSLARAYYRDVVEPLLSARWPGLGHAAGRLGSGSDVLGLDDAMSRDHDWGLRLTVLVDRSRLRQVDDYLTAALPQLFEGWPTRFATTWDSTVRHRIEVNTPAGFAASRLGLTPSGPLTVLDWLCLTGQSLLEVTGGAVFADSQGEITDIRRRLAWYPDDVWCYVVAAAWARIAEELPFVGRTGFRGDDAGSRVIAGRLAQTAMQLGFLLERRWPPYPKWLGTMFATLPGAGSALPALQAALAADTWQRRQEMLVTALGALHDQQRTTGLPTGDDDAVEPFFDRPFPSVRPQVVDVLLAAVTDPQVRRLPAGLGAVEQWVDNVKVLAAPRLRVAMAQACLSVAIAEPAAEGS